MEITFLGTGTSQGVPVIGCDNKVCLSTDPKDKRLRSSLLISNGGKNIVIDTGPDFRYQMLRSKTKKLEAVLITHEHRDHIAGLDDVRPFNFLSGNDMPVYATKRVQDNLRSVFPYIFFENPYPGAPKIDFETISKDSDFEVGGLQITPIEVMHLNMPVLGFRIGDFTYITDAKTIESSELEKVKGSKIIVLNALRKKPHNSHLNLQEALEWIRKINPERAYLTHISHRLGLHKEVQKELPENVFLAYDGLKLKL